MGMMKRMVQVSTHSRPKAAGSLAFIISFPFVVSTHSRPKAAGFAYIANNKRIFVSTHSRPKAAGTTPAISAPSGSGFNTQPPEGGWSPDRCRYCKKRPVSTHSRPKAAGPIATSRCRQTLVSTHSRPKAAGKTTNEAQAAIEFQHTAARRRLGFNELLIF